MPGGNQLLTHGVIQSTPNTTLKTMDTVKVASTSQTHTTNSNQELIHMLKEAPLIHLLNHRLHTAWSKLLMPGDNHSMTHGAIQSTRNTTLKITHKDILNNSQHQVNKLKADSGTTLSALTQLPTHSPNKLHTAMFRSLTPGGNP